MIIVYLLMSSNSTPISTLLLMIFKIYCMMSKYIDSLRYLSKLISLIFYLLKSVLPQTLPVREDHTQRQKVTKFYFRILHRLIIYKSLIFDLTSKSLTYLRISLIFILYSTACSWSPVSIA
jgi:hypothetical protein